jgi:hypothetical protein
MTHTIRSLRLKATQVKRAIRVDWPARSLLDLAIGRVTRDAPAFLGRIDFGIALARPKRLCLE